MTKKEGRRHNRRLAQWRVTWLIEHSTSHQLLWYIDSFVPRRRSDPKSATAPSAKTLPAILKTDKLKDFREKSKLYLQPIGYISIFATK